MNENVLPNDMWLRAISSLRTAEIGRKVAPDDAASRAYYAAFHTVCALFEIEGKNFKKHSAVENEVHFGLVKTRRWTADLGAKYKKLHRLSIIGDYGSLLHVSPEEAEAAIDSAKEILCAVHNMRPDVFDWQE